MKNKIYEFIMLILYLLLYGIAIGCLIVKGFQDSIQIVYFVSVSILVIARTFSATITLLNKEQQNER